MKIDVTRLSQSDFSKLVGEEINTPKISPLLHAIQVENQGKHVGLDEQKGETWATKIQDILEEKSVVYSKNDIEDKRFLGLKLVSHEDDIVLSLGMAGEVEPIITIRFNRKAENQIGRLIGVEVNESYQV